MQALKKFYFGKQKAKVNTFIGGIGGTINTPALLAARLGIAENRIKLFKVTGVDVECAVIGGSYVLKEGAFYNNSDITFFNDQSGLMSNTHNNGFRNAINLIYAILPNVSSIAGVNSNLSGAFQDCTKLQYVTAPKITSTGFRAFYNCGNMLTADYQLLVSVGHSAFYSCIKCVFTNATTQNITTLNNTLEFYNCRAQTVFSFPSLTTIAGNSTFESCIGVTSYAFPALQTISGFYNFRGNSSLTGLTLPVCTQISNRANVDMNSTEGLFKSNIAMTYFSAPVMTKAIANFMFNSCSAITDIYMPLCADLGGYSYDGSMNYFFYFIKTGCSITVPASLQTVAAGAMNPDLQYAISSRGAIVHYI